MGIRARSAALDVNCAYRAQVTSTSVPSLSRARERIDAICRSAPDVTTLRIEIVSEFRRQFDFDAYVWLLTDPVTTVGCSPLADVPMVEQLPALIRWKYLTEVNRWTRLASVAGLRARSLMDTSAGRPERSLIWREMLRDHGIVDVASTVFADRYGCWGFLDLWRWAPRPAFDRDIMRFLAAVAEPITTGLRRCQAITFATTAVATARELGPVVLILDGHLRVLSQTDSSEDWLRILVPPAPGRSPIPASAYNVGAQLLATESKIDLHPARARVHLADGFWVTVRAARLRGAEGPDGGHIAVTIEEASPVDRLEVFSLAHALSRRERELLTMVATGAGTADLAERLFVTEHTVQDHLKSIFGKTSTHSRRELLSRALGASSGPSVDIAG